MYADDPNYKQHPDDWSKSLLEPFQGVLWRMALTYLVNHPPVYWEYGICPSPSGGGTVMPLSAENLKQAIGEQLFEEATAYCEAAFAKYLTEKNLTDPRLVTA